jgi:phage gp37-like protein
MQQILDAVRDGLQAVIPGLRTCEVHGGRFDEDELRRVCQAAPAVYVAALDVRLMDRSLELTLAAFVVAKDSAGATRDRAALAMVAAALRGLDRQDWGLAATETAPAQVQAQNLFASRIAQRGVAMWGVSWRQRFALAGALDPATIDVLATVFAEQAQADGAPVAQDHITLPQE